MPMMDRRRFLQGSAAASGLVVAGPLEAFLARPRAVAAAGYGPLAPVPDHTTGLPLLQLPPGFEYWSFGEVGSPMSDGNPTPPAHDGMGCFRDGRKWRLVRNHEVRGTGPAFGPAGFAYDASAPGGTTTVIFDPKRPGDVESFASLAGTSTNCAGGVTPWRSWITCEEIVAEPSPGGFEWRHGYAFEVRAAADGFAVATPLRALGRFVHEAVAVDPKTGIVYLTEDAGACGLYRFVPRRKGRLDIGVLQMLAVAGHPGYDTRTGQLVGVELPVEWVDVPDPDPGLNEPSCYEQGLAQGGATFRRLEGICYSKPDRAFYVNATDGGDASAGQVWCYRPSRADGGTLTLVYESPSSDVLLKPDNITIARGGGILLCEDPDRARQAFLRGLTDDGVLYAFAANNRAGVIPGTSIPASFDEFAGACFSRDGEWLFVNIQTPGITFAITGPWERGPLGKRGAPPDDEGDEG